MAFMGDYGGRFQPISHLSPMKVASAQIDWTLACDSMSKDRHNSRSTVNSEVYPEIGTPLLVQGPHGARNPHKPR
jgi:hypothetical protein